MSLGQPSAGEEPLSGRSSLNASPYASPYGSPCSSPRIKRKPLKETKRASSEQLGDYVQLNQYKLDRVLGQGSYGMVKLAYNREDDKNYVSVNYMTCGDKIVKILFLGNENIVKEKASEESRIIYEKTTKQKRK